MTTPILGKVSLVGALALVSNYAAAAGFQLLEQNASGLGNAYAGSAAVADNASTIFYNPAGMTQLKEREASAGLTAVKTSFKFTDNGSSVGSLAGTGNGGDAGTWGYIPNGYLSWALNPDLYLGLGVGAPFGLKTEYSDKPWVGSAQANSFDVKTYNINPSVAYRVNKTVSVGAGLSWQQLTADYLRVASTGAGVTTTPVTMNLKGDSWGWNVGALFNVSADTKVGTSYRSTVNHDVTGTINVGGTVVPSNGSAKANIKLPDVFILSATHQVSNRWQLLGDLSWTGWSSIPRIDVIRTSAIPGFAAGTTAQTLDTDFRDAWRVAVGANYQLASDMKLKFGVAYDQTPVKGEATRLVSLPDNDRTWFSFGTQWQSSKGSALDVGVAYLYVKEAAINNDQTASGRGRVTGSYNNNAWILGAQYSFAF